MIKVYSETLCKVQISHLDNTHVPARKNPQMKTEKAARQPKCVIFKDEVTKTNDIWKYSGKTAQPKK